MKEMNLTEAHFQRRTRDLTTAQRAGYFKVESKDLTTLPLTLTPAVQYPTGTFQEVTLTKQQIIAVFISGIPDFAGNLGFPSIRLMLRAQTWAGSCARYALAR